MGGFSFRAPIDLLSTGRVGVKRGDAPWCVEGGGCHGKHACSVVLPGRSYGEEGESLFVREITGEGEGVQGSCKDKNVV